MEATLDQARDRLCGSAPGPLPAGAVVAQLNAPQPADAAAATPSAPGSTGPLVAQASEYYQRALQAQRDGNWALYGQEIERLGEVLAQLGTGP